MLQPQTAASETRRIYYERVDEEGYIIDTNEWLPAFSERRALQSGVKLTEKHWKLIDLIRDKYIRLGSLPPMRTVCKAVGVDKITIKAEFGSCLNLWKIAGLPNPGEEAKAYMN